ncbi:DeoR/GlpR transcriptional regulator [Clavibacter tessellarius]|uniref:DeoR family transcriptional regulator n=1 Tax=Clavibacter tessellarius TaxID=31965 RepID=A0A225CND9_9MICO|nr:DeoR/GlpR family DNA-binding transcription regulator [Clavibacter michiganensis]OQJ62924.1 DeoR family transcriptional regulator [Clavibacter michiganensis subsp. tessellarius]UKF34091.1 DeoR/GlpR transcriptional regulator [Clavibacter michiganensis subsp. tessellarius]
MADDSAPVPAATRRSRILERLGDRGFATVAELAADAGVSAVTIRGDLDALADSGALQRVHGGAVLRSGLAAREQSLEVTLESAADAKRAIGRAAADMVESGQSVLLDVGSTTLQVARALVAREDLVDVTVITNGLTLALELERAMPRFTVVVTGGTLRALQHSLVDPLATVVLDRLHPDVAFIGCNGIDVDRGVTNVNLPEAEVKRRMVAASARTVVVADGAKLGRTHLGSVAPLDLVDTLLTDADADPHEVARLRDAGLRVVEAAGSSAVARP